MFALFGKLERDLLKCVVYFYPFLFHFASYLLFFGSSPFPLSSQTMVSGVKVELSE